MKFKEFQLLMESSNKKIKFEYISGPKKNNPRFTFKVLDVYFTVNLTPNKASVYNKMPENIHPAFVAVNISSEYKSDSQQSTNVLNFVRKNIDIKEINEKLKDAGIAISTGRKFYDQNIVSVKDVIKDENMRFKEQIKKNPMDQSRLASNYNYNDNHPSLTKKAESIIKGYVKKMFNDNTDELLSNKKHEDNNQKLDHKSKNDERKNESIFDKHNVKAGISIKIRTRLDGIQEGVVTDGFELDDDGDLIVNWKNNDGEFWAYDYQIISLNGSPYSTYKNAIEKMFNKI